MSHTLVCVLFTFPDVSSKSRESVPHKFVKKKKFEVRKFTKHNLIFCNTQNFYIYGFSFDFLYVAVHEIFI